MNQREQQKQATRMALSEAAIDLFCEHGVEATRVEDIAASVGVTPRTFFLHFPTKHAAAFPDHEERVKSFIASLDELSAVEHPIEALKQTVLAGIRTITSSSLRRKRYQLLRSIPEFAGIDIVHDLDYEAAIIDHLTTPASNSGPVSADEMFAARNTASSILGLSRSALTTWAEFPDFDPVRAIEEGLDALLLKPSECR